MLTFTLPAPLRPVARSHQALLYDLLFRTSAAATQHLAADPRFIGGQLGLVGVLHTWGRTLTYHPHVHYLIPAGGLTPDAQIWQPAREDFLLPVKALSPIFRARFREALRPTDFFEGIPASVWQADWVVHGQPVGNGQTAFKYLAPYIFRVAISNSRILKLENDQVTFRYRATGSGQPKLCTLAVQEFIHRFLQHVLPKSFVKVRYYGFLSSGQRAQLATIRQQLGPVPSDSPSSSTTSITPASVVSPDSPTAPSEVVTPILDSPSASATTNMDTSSATGQAAPARPVVRCPVCGRDLLSGSILHASRRTGHPP
jgi:hypothetical protein